MTRHSATAMVYGRFTAMSNRAYQSPKSGSMQRRGWPPAQHDKVGIAAGLQAVYVPVELPNDLVRLLAKLT